MKNKINRLKLATAELRPYFAHISQTGFLKPVLIPTKKALMWQTWADLKDYWCVPPGKEKIKVREVVRIRFNQDPTRVLFTQLAQELFGSDFFLRCDPFKVLYWAESLNISAPLGAIRKLLPHGRSNLGADYKQLTTPLDYLQIGASKLVAQRAYCQIPGDSGDFPLHSSRTLQVMMKWVGPKTDFRVNASTNRDLVVLLILGFGSDDVKKALLQVPKFNII